MATPLSRHSASDLLRGIGWGIFCACSWTWCIGMYLPVILLRDYGWAGFIAFAVPNVLGCAAFGYVVARPQSSRQFVERHSEAIRWFAGITIAYHLFFLGWKVNPLSVGRPEVDVFAAALTAGALGLAGWLASFVVARAPVLCAVLTYSVSIAAFALVGLGALPQLSAEGMRPTTEIIWMLPALWFGFLLCPYLDPTFHQALQQSPSKHSFAVFGLSFAVMILFTCAYSLIAADRFSNAILLHLVIQTVFTVGAQGAAMRTLPKARSAWTVRALAFVWGLSIAAGAWFAGTGQSGETAYLRFLGCYGLAFPLAVTWGWCGSMRSRLGLLATILILAPAFEWGMVNRLTWVLPIGVAAAIATGLLHRRLVSGRLNKFGSIGLDSSGQ